MEMDVYGRTTKGETSRAFTVEGIGKGGDYMTSYTHNTCYAEDQISICQLCGEVLGHGCHERDCEHKGCACAGCQDFDVFLDSYWKPALGLYNSVKEITGK